MNKIPAVRIVRATLEDIPFIKDLAQRVWWAHYPEIITDEQIRYMLGAWYSAPALREQMAEGGQEYWLIKTDEQEAPCGYLSMSRKEQTGSYYLHKFYLEGRGKGVGAVAFNTIMAQYPDLKELRLNVNRRNFKSVNFYFKVGFKIESVMDLEVGEKYIMDDFVMVYLQ
jgi:hypothetical protein